MTSEPISGRQIRAARALAGWHRADLARESGVNERTIARLEDGDPAGQNPRPATLEGIRLAFERAGVVFIPPVGGGEGVRRRHR